MLESFRIGVPGEVVDAGSGARRLKGSMGSMGPLGQLRQPPSRHAKQYAAYSQERPKVQKQCPRTSTSPVWIRSWHGPEFLHS